MKKRRIKNASYNGEPVSKTFITGFQIQMLETLQKRGVFNERQLLKAMSILKERLR